MVGLRKPFEPRPQAHQNDGLLVPPYAATNPTPCVPQNLAAPTLARPLSGKPGKWDNA